MITSNHITTSELISLGVKRQWINSTTTDKNGNYITTWRVKGKFYKVTTNIFN